MQDILEILKILQHTKIPNLLVILGFVFLLIAFVGRIGTIIELPRERQKWAGLIGGIFLLFGIGLFALPIEENEPIPPTTVSASPARDTVIREYYFYIGQSIRDDFLRLYIKHFNNHDIDVLRDAIVSDHGEKTIKKAFTDITGKTIASDWLALYKKHLRNHGFNVLEQAIRSDLSKGKFD